MSGGQIGQVVGAIAGGIIGFFAGGQVYAGAVLGASIGSAVGGIVGNLLDPPKMQVPEPKMQKMQMSEYGRPIPLLYGTDRFAGTVIWQKYPFDKHEESSGGKGGGTEVESVTFSTSFAVMITGNEIVDVLQVFADGRLVWDGEDTDTFSFVLYKGTETQLPDPTMEAIIGVGDVPGHRGTAYVVFTDLALKDFFERIPQLEFVCTTVGDEIIPIERIAQNYDSAATYYGPAIVGWTRNTAEYVRIGEMDGDSGVFTARRSPITEPYRVHVYNGELTYLYEDVPGPGDALPLSFTLANQPPNAYGNGYPYNAIGMYDPGDGTKIPLWTRVVYTISGNDYGIEATGLADADIPMLVTQGNGSGPNEYTGLYSYIPGGNPNANYPRGEELAVQWGVPAGLFIKGSSISQDGTKLYLFTSPTAASGANVDTWYEIIEGEVARTGAVNPPISKSQIGFGSSAGSGSTGTNMMENNGRYMWLYAPNAALTTETGGMVGIWEIDPNTLEFAFNTFYGLAQVGGPIGGAATSSSIQVLKTGYAGIARDDGKLAIFRRVQPSEGVRLGDIISDLSSRTWLLEDEYDTTDQNQIVEGFRVTAQMEVANAIQPLRQAYFVDAVERDGVIVWVNRGGDAEITIPDDDLASHSEGSEAPAKVQIHRVAESELPRRVAVTFVDKEFDYQQGSLYEERQVTESVSDTTVALPLVFASNKARQICKALLWEGHVGREAFVWRTGRKYIACEPTTVVDIQGMNLRIETAKELADGNIEWTGRLSRQLLFLPESADDPNYGAGGGSSQPPQTPPTAKAATFLVLIDIPVLTLADAPYGFYAAMCAVDDRSWGGANLYKSLDSGETWVSVATTTRRDAIGTIAESLDSSDVSPVDLITVSLKDPNSTLSSCTDEALANGANLCAIQSGAGWEIAQYQTATLTATDPIGRKTYEITLDVRGLKGTEGYMSGHAAGDLFVALPCVNVDAPQSELNQEFLYKAVTFGALFSSGVEQAFTNTGEGAGGSSGGGGSDPTDPGNGWFDGVANGFPIGRKVITTGTYTLLDSDRATLLQFTTTCTVTCPTTLPKKWWCFIQNIGVGSVTLDPAGSAQLDGAGTSLVLTAAQGVFLEFDGTDYGTMRGVGGSGGGITDGDYGDIVVSAGGTVWTIDALAVTTGKIADDAVTNAKLANMATATVKMRRTAGTGDPEDISVANLKTDLGLTGTNSGDQTITLTGDVIGFGTGTFATTIVNGHVTRAMLADSSALSVIGRSANSTGVPADIAAANNDEVLRRSGTSLGFGQVATAGIADDAVTAAKLADTAVTPATYGSATNVGQFTVDQQGRITAAADVAITTSALPLTITSKSANYTLVIGDAGNGFIHPASDANPRTWTIPANSSVAFPDGTTIVFINMTGGANFISIAITTDTLYLGGTSLTGTRTLQLNGVATALKISSTEWIINGTALG